MEIVRKKILVNEICNKKIFVNEIEKKKKNEMFRNQIELIEL